MEFSTGEIESSNVKARLIFQSDVIPAALKVCSGIYAFCCSGQVTKGRIFLPLRLPPDCAKLFAHWPIQHSIMSNTIHRIKKKKRTREN